LTRGIQSTPASIAGETRSNCDLPPKATAHVKIRVPRDCADSAFPLGPARFQSAAGRGIPRSHDSRLLAELKRTPMENGNDRAHGETFRSKAAEAGGKGNVGVKIEAVRDRRGSDRALYLSGWEIFHGWGRFGRREGRGAHAVHGEYSYRIGLRIGGGVAGRKLLRGRRAIHTSPQE